MNRRLIRTAAVAVPLVLAGSLAACASSPAPGNTPAAAGDPVSGGTLTYLEHQAYTNLYPPQAGFYPNGGIVNNIAARLTWQNPDARDRALDRRGVDRERRRHGVHLRPQP